MLRVRPSTIVLTHNELKDFQLRLKYRRFLERVSPPSSSYDRASSQDSNALSDPLDNEGTEVIAETTTREGDDIDDWTFSEEGTPERPRDTFGGPQDTFEGSPALRRTWELPIRGPAPSPVSIAATAASNYIQFEAEQRGGRVQLGRHRFLADDHDPRDHDSEESLESPTAEYLMPVALPASAHAQSTGRASFVTGDRPTTPLSPSREGFVAGTDTRLSTARRLPVYNDALSMRAQPQTPRHLPEARHQSRFDGSYTAPVGGRRGRTVRDLTSGVQARRGGSPSGLRTPGFQGLFGGRENAEEG
ncbi:hypothetical protein AK830_g5370 [Neonectria ditissima]|uniref:Uncharacterized protein n=1 Tax=Neonectria ditissima TaxID=78410 RepID=A0A0P7BEI8_9HYPO|nr:hypothetical protein AK830_g5370 [Neonectria ditissima]